MFDYLADTPSQDKWKKIGMRQRAGTLVPIWFLRSSQSLGIGDFSDFEQFIQLSALRGESIVQILPINDTGPDHLWPYSGISGFAINPALMSVDFVLKFYEKQSLVHQIQSLKAKLKKKDKLSLIEYATVYQLKLEIFSIIFDEIYATIIQEIERFKKDELWVEDYALYCAISNQLQCMNWMQWSDPALKDRSESALRHFKAAYQKEIDFYCFLQLTATVHLKQIKQMANQKGILIKGDIPILVDTVSVDRWAHPDCFLIEYGAGAPPDMFTKGGQEWGNPPLNLESPDAIRYFFSRFQFAEKWMDLVRIDHILGLFRILIWKKNKNSMLNHGFFYPQHQADQGLALSEDCFSAIHLDPESLCDYAGNVTDSHYLGGLAQVLVAKRFANWVDDQKIEWMHSLDLNEDYYEKLLVESGFNPDQVEQIILQRKRLKNMLCHYLDFKDSYCFAFDWQKTWQYLNLSLDQKQYLNEQYDRQLHAFFEFWAESGKQFLIDLNQATRMLLCGEDLGLVDPYIPRILNELGIPGMNVLRWEFSYELDAQRSIAVLTSSTHDTSSLFEWWANEADLNQRTQLWHSFFGAQSNFEGQLTNAEQKELLMRFYAANSIFVMVPFWETLTLWQNEPDVRINLPGALSDRNWIIRMEHTLEDILSDSDCNQEIYSAIKDSGR